MPEHSTDPIRALEDFRPGALGHPPLDPTEVRRLGDRRRTRRHTLVGVAAAVAVLAAVVPVAVLAAGDDTGGRSPEFAPAPPSPTSTPSPSTKTATPAPGVITFPGNGLELDDPGEVDELEGTTPAFRAYIKQVIIQTQADGESCPDAFHGVTVQKYSSAGYAIGGVNACGGYVALWVQRDGVWQEGMGTQDGWDCDTLSYLDVPVSFAGECSQESGSFGPDAVGDIRLGMTEAQIEAAGGTVTDSPGGESCRGLLFPYQLPVENRTDGSFSERRGLVAMFARPGMKTPERIGLGSSLDKVRAAYPQGQLGENGYWVVPLGGDTEYQFGIEADDTVGEVVFTRTDQDCFG